MRSFRTKLTDFAIFFVPRAVGTAVVLVIVIGLFGWIGLAAAITALSAFFL